MHNSGNALCKTTNLEKSNIVRFIALYAVIAATFLAIGYLAAAKAGNTDCSLPDLILLDLNMPGIGGKEFLKRIKADDDLDTIPVVILTTSDSDQDILDSYKLHASGYIKKPVSLDGFGDILDKLEDYWFVICKRVSKEQLQWAQNQ